MKLLKLKLHQFQGIEHLELDFPDGCSGSIAKVITDGTVWKLNSIGVWQKQPDEAGDLASLKEYLL